MNCFSEHFYLHSYYHKDFIINNLYDVLQLSIEPGSPWLFLTCGEDGVVYQMDLREEKAKKYVKPTVELIYLSLLCLSDYKPINYYWGPQ